MLKSNWILFEHVGVLKLIKQFGHHFKTENKHLDCKNHETKTRVIKTQLVVKISELHVGSKVMIICYTAMVYQK